MSCSPWLLADELAGGMCRVLGAFDEALMAALGSSRPPPEGLSEADRERIRQSVWRLRNDLEELGRSGFFEAALKLMQDAFGGPEGFTRTVAAWAKLIDTLIQESECALGRKPGRGGVKRRQVKGALLYLARRSDVDLPRIPGFAEPLVWEVVLDPAIDAIVQLSNRHGLWTARAPESPTTRARVLVVAGRASSWLEGFSRWLGGLLWRLVLSRSPVAPPLKRAVDDFLLADPEPVETVQTLVRWVAVHSGDIVVISDLLTVAVIEAEFVMQGDEELRKEYARELLLAFLEDAGSLPPRSSVRFLLLSAMFEIGIDVAVSLLRKRRHPAFQPR